MQQARLGVSGFNKVYFEFSSLRNDGPIDSNVRSFIRLYPVHTPVI